MASLLHRRSTSSRNQVTTHSLRFFVSRPVDLTMSRRSASCFIFLVFAAVIGDSTCATAAERKPPVAAFIDADKSSLGALLEAQLFAQGRAQWVERDRIDNVLKEQLLQAVFSPTAIGERSKLGRLLQADVLIILRKGPVKA